MKKSIITGTGSFLPDAIKKNSDFDGQEFYTENSEKIAGSSLDIAAKFEAITGIRERRYLEENINTSDIATIASKLAIEDAGIDKESIDQIIFAHNFGDVPKGTIQSDILPALASRVKHELAIINPFCVAYDLIFGCPGWVQGLIQADAFGISGQAKTSLIIGAEALSRVLDPYDRDSMIFSDGAGACILEYKESLKGEGILSSSAMSHTNEEAYYLFLGKSNFPNADEKTRYIKMKGRKVYEYALKNVPLAMKHALDKTDVHINDVKKIFIHQANEKLDMEVVKRFYKLYDIQAIPEGIMPMSVHEFGNSSVATVPTLFDRVKKGIISDHQIQEGDVVIFASVGAGMNINAVCYRC